MKSYNIAVMGGDGTGPEVVREAVKVLDAVAPKFNLKLNYTDYDLGGERYLRTGEVLPESMLASTRSLVIDHNAHCEAQKIQPKLNSKKIRTKIILRHSSLSNLFFLGRNSAVEEGVSADISVAW